MVMSKQTQTKLKTRLAKLEKENLRKEKEISRKEKENQRLKAKQAKENLRKEKENQRLKAKQAKENLRKEKENQRLKAKQAKENLRKEKENQRLKAKQAKENLRKEKEISRKEKENQRLKAKQAKENLRKEKEISRKEKENQRLKAKQAKEISRLKTILAKEDSLWNTELGQKRHSSVLPTRLLHTHEMLEYIISNEKLIKALTRSTKEIFDNTLEDLLQIIKKSNDSPHFRDDQDRKEESGNQCKLYIRHFLLMTQVRKSQDWGQESLGVVFGIDQSTVSNYLKLANKYDDELYTVTPYNMTKYISTIKSKEEFKEIVPGRDGGEITIDGTLVETTRPEDKEEQKKQYSGKGKMFAIEFMINRPKNKIRKICQIFY